MKKSQKHLKVIAVLAAVIMGFPLFSAAEDKADFSIDQCSNAKLEEAVRQLQKDDSSGSDVLARCNSKSVPVLIKAIKNQNPKIRARAVSILGVNGSSSASAIPALISELKDPKSDLQENIIEALGDIGENAKAVVPAIIPYLKYKDPSTRIITATALLKLGYESVDVTSILSAALRDKNSDDDLVDTLGYIGPNAAPLVPTLIELLKSSEDSYKIIETLGKIGKGAKAAVPTLIDQLRHKDDLVRSMSLEALGEIGENAKAAIPALVAFLQDKRTNGENSDQAADALGKMGKDAVSPLLVLLKSQNIEMRITAARTLGEIGHDAKAAIPDLIAIFTDQKLNAQSRARKRPSANFEQNSPDRSTALLDEAASALGRTGIDAVPYLLGFLRDRNPEVRSRAASALSVAGKDAVPALIKLIKDQDEDIRFLALDSLRSIGKDAGEAIPALIAVFRDYPDRSRDKNQQPVDLLEIAKTGGVEGFKDAIAQERDLGMRYKASDVLGEIGSLAIPALIQALKDENVNVRLGAIESLEKIDKNTSAVVTALTPALVDRDSYVRIRAAFVLSRTAKDDRAGISALIAALNDKDEFIRSNALQYLVITRSGNDANRNGNDATPALISAFNDKSNPSRNLVLEALGTFRSESHNIVPILSDALKEENSSIRLTAASSIAEIYKTDEIDSEVTKKDPRYPITPKIIKDVVPILITALQDKDIVTRFKAAYALSFIGKEARAAIPALTATLKDSGIGVRGWAASALGAIGDEAKEVVPLLINELKNQSSPNRYSFAEALGGIGQAAKDAVPILIDIFMNEKEETYLRHAAVGALKKIGSAEALSALSKHKETVDGINQKINARNGESTIIPK